MGRIATFTLRPLLTEMIFNHSVCRLQRHRTVLRCSHDNWQVSSNTFHCFKTLVESQCGQCLKRFAWQHSEQKAKPSSLERWAAFWSGDRRSISSRFLGSLQANQQYRVQYNKRMCAWPVKFRMRNRLRARWYSRSSNSFSLWLICLRSQRAEINNV